MMNEKEIWKPVKNYEGYYEVSNLGRVKRLERIQVYSDGRTQTLKEHICKGSVTTCGYLRIALTKNKKRIGKYIHTLVAQAFIPNPNNLHEVNHKDYNKKNNCVDNLEWCTHQENVRDMLEHYGIKRKQKRYCIDCGKEIYYYKSTRCQKCASINRNKDRSHKPDRETLKFLIKNNPMLSVGKMFNVSDNAVRKWCKSYNLPYKSTEIRKYTDEEWILI